MRYTSVVFTIFMFALLNLSGTYAQVKWERGKVKDILPLQLFHSPQSINLPTAETLQQGDLEFEISHRFLPSIKDGIKDLYGFDGPVNIRFGLAYAVTDNFVLSLGRSNVDDNLDLKAKHKLFEFKNETVPLLTGLQFGAAWNTDPSGRGAGDSKNFQYFVQIILNTMFEKKFAVGLVPSYLYNSNIYRDDYQDSFTLGINAQYYISSLLSVLAEYNPTVSGYRNRFDSMAFGIELETGGHFFKVILTNNSLLNSAQFLAGSDRRFEDGEWRIGFNITRLLKF